MTQYHFCTFGRFATYRNMIWNIALVEKDLKKKDIWGYNKGIHLQGTEQSNCNISEDAHLWSINQLPLVSIFPMK